MAGKAKMYTSEEVEKILNHITTTLYPLRNKVMFLFSLKMGLRAKEIAYLRWEHVTTPSGAIGEVVMVERKSTKGERRYRELFMSYDLIKALNALYESYPERPRPDQHILVSKFNQPMSASAIKNWFYYLKLELGLNGISSHSGRRTAITTWFRNMAKVDGSPLDVQIMAGHSNLKTTLEYIECNREAMRKVVNL